MYIIIEGKILNHKIKNKMIKTRSVLLKTNLNFFLTQTHFCNSLYAWNPAWYIRKLIRSNLSSERKREIYKSSRVITNKTEAGNILETRKTLEHSKHSGFAFDDISPRYLVSRSDSTSFDGSIKFCPGDIIRWRVWGLGIIKFVSAVTTIT